MSKIEFVSKNKENNRSTFLLKESTPALANALRRTIIDSVPTMAIEDVEFSENSSALYDEMISHRLGLIPLTTDLKSYNLPEKCKCNGEGCGRCTVKLVLKTKGPGYIYASDLKSKDPAIKPVYPEMIIVKLLKGQELAFEATAVLGKGLRHVKFSPGLVWYNYKPTITVNNNHPKFDEFKDKYPQKAFKDGKLDKKLIEENNLYDACNGINDDIVKIEYDPSTFVFNIEPWGQLTPKEMLTEAFNVLNEKLQELDEKLSK